MILKKTLRSIFLLGIGFLCRPLLFCMEVVDDHVVVPNGYCYIFAHGFGVTRAGVNGHLEAYRRNYIIGENTDYLHPNHGQTVLSTQFPVFNDTKNLSLSSLGQEEDIAMLIQTIHGTIARNPTHQIVGFGVSRGAATWINAIGILAQTGMHNVFLHIAALVLESPFCSSSVLAKDLINKYGLHSIGFDANNSVVRWIGNKALSHQLPRHNPKGLQPIKSIKTLWQNVPRNLPILFIHSKKDNLIPINHSRNLVKELRNAGFTDIYLAEVPGGDHANLFWGGSNRMACRYIHAFYRRNNLPNIPDEQLFTQDRQVLEMVIQEMQPTSDELDRRIFEDEPCCFLRQIWNTLFN